MPICINCSHPLPHLYTVYSKADDRTLGKGVRLTQCSNCKRFADKYVEHDYVVLFIDLVLIKPQVYRHLLFNRLSNTGVRASASASASSIITHPNTTSSTQRHDRLDPSIARLGILLVLFDVYITWARIEKGSNGDSNRNRNSDNGDRDGGVLANWPILGQYLFFLTLNLLSTVAQHATIRLLASYFFSGSRQHTESIATGSGADGWSHGHGHGHGHAHGHSRVSSNATERPRDRDRDGGAGSTTPATTTASSALSPAALLRKMSSHNSPQLHQHESHAQSHSRFGHGSPTPQHDGTFSTHAEHHHAPHTSLHRSPPSGSAISTALLVSSCTKLFPILLVIWPTTGGSADPSASASACASASTNGDDSSFAVAAAATAAGPFGSRAASYIGWVVLFNNIEALMILLQPESGYLGVTALAVAGFVVRFVVEGCLLSTVSLAMDGSGPVGDFLGLLAWVKGRIDGFMT